MPKKSVRYGGPRKGSPQGNLVPVDPIINLTHCGKSITHGAHRWARHAMGWNECTGNIGCSSQHPVCPREDAAARRRAEAEK